MWHSGDGMGWWMMWGALMMVLFWGTIIALAFWAAQSLTRRGGEGDERRTPLDIAKTRYASGEITREQFEQLRNDLGR